MSAYPRKNTVLFARAFAHERAENISHITLDGERTPCGRRGWETEEGWSNVPPDCRVCLRAWERLSESERSAGG